MPSASGDYYRRLRLSPNASRQEIRSAFRRLARQYHPQLHPHKPGAARTFRSLREAYDVLIDRVLRSRYDQQQHGYGLSHPSAAPQSPSDFYIRGMRHARAQRYRVAMGDYSQAIRLDDEFAEAYMRRAEVRYLLNDDSGVLNDCSRAIALNSTEAKTYYYQGMARYRLGYVESAIAAFTDAITCDPQEASYFYRRGIAHQDLNELDNAAKDLRRAVHLFREQGDVDNAQYLKQHLRQFGTAGRSRLVKLLSALPRRLSLIVSGTRRKKIRPAALLLPAQSDSTVSAEMPMPPMEGPGRTINQRNLPIEKPRTLRQQQGGWPLFRAPRQPRLTPGVSSRPDPRRPLPQPRPNLLAGAATTLRLLSNPAGEMVPIYRQLSHRQVTLVGYGLAVLGNLFFVLGAMQHVLINSWLVASWFWASGGLTFVAMVVVMAIARLLCRVQSLWVADIFILGTAMVPLGLLAVSSALLQYVPDSTLHIVLLLVATLWACSHALITVHSGLSRIHHFPEQTAGWFTPVILVLGLCTGVGTWLLMTAGL
ncbi:MAG: DnaJ domain-containing protein [Cyanobacteria bacterium P01_A01_bin.116]